MSTKWPEWSRRAINFVFKLFVVLLLTNAVLGVPNQTSINDGDTPDLERAEPSGGKHSKGPSGGLSKVKKEMLRAKSYLDKLEPTISKMCNKATAALWNFNTNQTDETARILMETEVEAAVLDTSVFSSHNKTFSKDGPLNNWPEYDNARLVRRIRHAILPGFSALPRRDIAQMAKIHAKLHHIYKNASICFPDGTCGHPLANVTVFTSTNRDYDALAHVWKSWRDATGREMRKTYYDLMDLMNKAARLNGFNDAGHMWTHEYESHGFKNEVANVFEDLKPLYKKLFAFVRHRLQTIYGDRIPQGSQIPAHVLGQVWGATWAEIGDLIKPYPRIRTFDSTAALKRSDFDVKKMARVAEAFFEGLGLKSMTKSFWDNSMFQEPNNRKVECQPSAWDFCLGPSNEDFRIKMCGKPDHDTFMTLHHEMAQIEYFMHYKYMPMAFRNGACSGFHSAIGDAIVLSVSTPKYLQGLGMLPTWNHTTYLRNAQFREINRLMALALEKVAFIPFAYAVDKWRWDVFSGRVPKGLMNSHWWKLREEIQGLAPPVYRSDAYDLDPLSISHVAMNLPYIRNFVSTIVEFQLYEALCVAAGEYDPRRPEKASLNECDFHGHDTSGKLLKGIMALGASEPWPQILRRFSGSTQMSAGSLLRYFKPLEEFLDKFLAETGECPGWGAECEKKPKPAPITTTTTTTKPVEVQRQEADIAPTTKLSESAVAIERPPMEPEVQEPKISVMIDEGDSN